MKKTSCLLACLLTGLLALPGLAAETARVAVMVHRPSNRLAWNCLGEEAAFMLACDQVLRQYVDATDRIALTGAYNVNGIYSAMQSGLYFPEGEDLHEKWQPFLQADIYLEAKLSKRKLVWHGGTAETTTSAAVDAPFRNPKAGAAALVRLVFELAGVPLDAEAEKELADPETRDPQLWFEWAKWIGYRPHWLHHAPWQGPHASSKKILMQDPTFVRGAAWALKMVQKRGKNQKQSPASPRYLPSAYRVLDSPYHAQAYGFIRKQLEETALLREALKLFDLPQLEMQLGMDMTDTSNDNRMGAAGEETMDEQELPSGPRFRSELALTLGGIRKEAVGRCLAVLLTEDESAEVRAAAAQALAGFPTDATAEHLGTALAEDKAPVVRAAALQALAKQKRLALAQAQKAARGERALELALVRSLPGGTFAPEASAALVSTLLQSEHAQTRTACLRLLRETNGVATRDDAVQTAVAKALADGTDEEALAALAWVRANKASALVDRVALRLAAETPAVRAAAARTLAQLAPDRIDGIVKNLASETGSILQTALADVLAASGEREQYRDALFALLKRARPAAYGHICMAAYELLGPDRKALARAMRFDPSLLVNMAALRLVERLGDPALARDVLSWCAEQHPNEYIRARALHQMEAMHVPGVRELCRKGLSAPFWVVRLEAADVLSRQAQAEDAEAIRRAQAKAEDEWLSLALEDALCKAEGRPAPRRVRLGLGEREHTEGGDTPNGFQVWLGNFPKDLKQARELVDQGYRLGVKNKEPNMPGGTVLNAYNSNAGARNTYLIQSILDPLENWKKKLPYLYYIALFDEPCTLGGGFHPSRVRAMLLEAARPDLLHLTRTHAGDALGEALPPELREAFQYYNAKFGGEASNWVVHMYRLTAQRKYPDLRIFPQSLTYMRQHTHDAFDMIDADGDYSWKYHYGNFFRDGTIGAVNRVINPGKPACMITWMSWYKPNILKGNTLYIDSAYIDGPWRFRNYMGTRSSLALYATGTEAGFFDPIGLGVTSDKEARGGRSRAFALKPWSKEADRAVNFLLSDKGFWKAMEGKIALKLMKENPKEDNANLMEEEDTGLGDDLGLDELEDKPDPLEVALKAKREELYTELMVGISYMNIFNTDATRALSNLPKPDTRLRDSLIIVGRDTYWWGDGKHMFMPAIAVVQGYDLVPNYDAIGSADLMHYDTILLRASGHGVTAALVAKVNQWLHEKENGLLVVWGPCHSKKHLFPMFHLDPVKAPFLWEKSVQFHPREQITETYKDRRKRTRTRRTWPHLTAFRTAGGETVEDGETRLACTFSGAVAPLIATGDKHAVLARWKAPDEVKSVVLFDGAAGAGPIYTGALEQAILAMDEERGADVQRNRWWGHTLYETDQFVVDVTTSQLPTLHQARPRKHKGVDVITGVINPEVRHGQCAMVLKDYVGPYAGGKGDWAVLARKELLAMERLSPKRLKVHAKGVTRVSHIGPEAIRLADPDGFEQVENQVFVWKQMREGKRAFSTNDVDGGKELHFVSPDPVVVVVE